MEKNFKWHLLSIGILTTFVIDGSEYANKYLKLMHNSANNYYKLVKNKTKGTSSLDLFHLVLNYTNALIVYCGSVPYWYLLYNKTNNLNTEKAIFDASQIIGTDAFQSFVFPILGLTSVVIVSYWALKKIINLVKLVLL